MENDFVGMQLCFYCGECKGVLINMRLRGTFKDRKGVVTDIEPCDDCKEKYKDYQLVLEKPSETAPPTGRWFAVKKEAISEEYRNSPIVFMLSGEFQQIIDNHKGD